MARLANASIRYKLRILLSVSILFMLFVAGSILMINSFFSSRLVLSQEVNALAEVTSLAITPSLIFDNKTNAQQTLNTLGAHNHIIYASVFKKHEQQIFALYQRDSEWQLSTSELANFLQCQQHTFSLAFLSVCKSLVFDNVTYGKIVLVISLHDIYLRLLKELGIALLGLIFASGLIFIILDRFVQKLTIPILELLAISEQVSQSGKYNNRATIQSSDEIGRLGQAFNLMLDKIQVRNNTLTQQKETLEELVCERTLEKDQALILADQAQKASNAKSDFLSVMSHEIRTPLNAILGFSDLLKETQLNQQQREYINIINQSGNSLFYQINDILDFSKIEAGKMELDCVWFDMYELLLTVLTSNRYACSQKLLHLQHQIDPDLPRYLYGDKQKLKQILYNLLNNAIKFTETGTISLAVKFQQANEGFCIITFVIKDTGIGISESEQAKLFEPFTQADSSTTRKYGGTGLGLAIVKRMIKLQKGELALRSTKGVGTTIILKIPFSLLVAESEKERLERPLIALFEKSNHSLCALQLKQLGYKVDMIDSAAIYVLEQKPELANKYQLMLFSQECLGQSLFWQQKNLTEKKKNSLAYYYSGTDQIENSLQLSARLEAINMSKGGLEIVEQINRVAETHASAVGFDIIEGNINVLVVEDNQVNLLMTQKILQQIGLKSQSARNGKQAIELVKSHNFSLILMDCQMPVMDGLAATREIRNIEQYDNRHIPIIALTANAFKEDREACAEAGMDGYLTKPFKKKQLIDQINLFLKRDNSATLANHEKIVDGVLDPLLLKELMSMDMKGSKQFITELSETFFTNAEQLMQQIELAFSEHTIETIEKAAHQLKSSSLNVAASGLSELYKELEVAAKQTDYQTAEKLWEFIRLELHLVKTAYATIL